MGAASGRSGVRHAQRAGGAKGSRSPRWRGCLRPGSSGSSSGDSGVDWARYRYPKPPCSVTVRLPVTATALAGPPPRPATERPWGPRHEHAAQTVAHHRCRAGGRAGGARRYSAVGRPPRRSSTESSCSCPGWWWRSASRCMYRCQVRIDRARLVGIDRAVVVKVPLQVVPPYVDDLFVNATQSCSMPDVGDAVKSAVGAVGCGVWWGCLKRRRTSSSTGRRGPVSSGSSFGATDHRWEPGAEPWLSNHLPWRRCHRSSRRGCRGWCSPPIASRRRWRSRSRQGENRAVVVLHAGARQSSLLGVVSSVSPAPGA